MLIYAVTNDVNDKVYIGLAIGDLQHRWKVHLCHAKKGNDKCRALHSAMRKYGPEKFHVTALWSGHIRKTQLRQLESYFIHSFSTLAPNGYNLTNGGEGLIQASDETRKRMSDGAKAYAAKYGPIQTGRKHTAEQKMANSKRIKAWCV